MSFKNNYRVRKRESESMATLAGDDFLPFFLQIIINWLYFVQIIEKHVTSALEIGCKYQSSNA
jgi:hypothetical protein